MVFRNCELHLGALEALINFAREEARSPSIDSAALKAKLGNKLDGLLRTATA
jgi:hypothetical protein